MARLFTLDEANALLPQLRTLLTELRQAVEELITLEGGAEPSGEVRRNGHHTGGDEVGRQRRLQSTVTRLVGEVQALEVELKDPRTGLIDFSSLRAGQVVHLCWKLDEPEVAFWHPLDSGFAGRQPI
jgi:hypothetical protein